MRRERLSLLHSTWMWRLLTAGGHRGGVARGEGVSNLVAAKKSRTAERPLSAVSQGAPVSGAREPGLATWPISGATGCAGS